MSDFTPIELASQAFQPEARSTGSMSDGVMGKHEFLRLLVAQLSHQDPLNPQAAHEFASQLAQFSSVEQLLNISEVLAMNGEINAVLAQSVNSGVAAGLIGKSIEADGNRIDWSGETSTGIRFKLGAPAESVKISIHDENGRVVRTLELSGQGSGDHAVDWDGRDGSGARIPPGVYTYSVTATDASGATVPVETTFRGKVDRVTFGKDGILLWIGRVSIPLHDVKSVSE
jgi:flagellar basal-body rod modification protein FlgD